jgi:hypothetical protein
MQLLFSLNAYSQKLIPFLTKIQRFLLAKTRASQRQMDLLAKRPNLLFLIAVRFLPKPIMSINFANDCIGKRTVVWAGDNIYATTTNVKRTVMFNYSSMPYYRMLVTPLRREVYYGKVKRTIRWLFDFKKIK